jgi:hypothetical protein
MGSVLSACTALACRSLEHHQGQKFSGKAADTDYLDNVTLFTTRKSYVTMTGLF